MTWQLVPLLSAFLLLSARLNNKEMARIISMPTIVALIIWGVLALGVQSHKSEPLWTAMWASASLAMTFIAVDVIGLLGLLAIRRFRLRSPRNTPTLLARISSIAAIAIGIFLALDRHK
jgi:threonine/homoserine/homoserine lactone efflux protein